MGRFSQGQLWNIFFHWTNNTKKSKKFKRVHWTVLYQFAVKNFQNINIYLFYVQKITNMLSSLLIQIMKWFKFEVVIWTVYSYFWFVKCMLLLFFITNCDIRRQFFLLEDKCKKPARCLFFPLFCWDRFTFFYDIRPKLSFWPYCLLWPVPYLFNHEAPCTCNATNGSPVERRLHNLKLI